MIAIDGSYLYEFGKAIQPVFDISENDTNITAWFKCNKAKTALDELLTQSVFIDAIKIAAEPARNLLNKLNAYAELPPPEKAHEKFGWNERYEISEALRAFDTIFKAEFRTGSMFLATSKGGFELNKMIFNGETLLPSALSKKVPEATQDVRDGTKCMAFELYTAAGFHLHRANECVLLRYFDIVSKGKERPDNRNMGAYIKALEAEKAPRAITSCLRDLKDMHRNPLMHPDQSIDNLDDSIALLNSIYISMTAMLKEIPNQA